MHNYLLPADCFRRIIGKAPTRPARPAYRPPVRCVGHFWDKANKKSVSVDLGEVVLRFPSVFRAVPSEVENQSNPTRVEGTALSAESESGFYVIPGLCTPRETLPANPRRYWLAAQALFTKLAKLFQLNQLVRVSCNTRILCPTGHAPRKSAPLLACSVGTFCGTAETVPACRAVDVGTSPHGLSVSLAVTHQETSGKAGGLFPAKPVLILGAQERRDVVPRLRRSPPPSSALHRLELTECEFLHAYSAVEQDRNRTRKAIRQGKAMPQDLQCTDGLWEKLQTVMFARMKGGQP